MKTHRILFAILFARPVAITTRVYAADKDGKLSWPELKAYKAKLDAAKKK